eukprot:jgi/Botrbrau1/10214/Bobra.0362s0004.1
MNFNFLVEDLRITSTANGKLTGLKVVFSPLLHVKGIKSSYAEFTSLPSGVANNTTKALQVLLDAGANVVGRTTLNEISFGLGAGSGAPASPLELQERVGISGTGAALALSVALGRADVAIGIDHIVGLRAQAAQSGLYCCRVSQQQKAALLGDHVSVAGELDSLAWACKDPATFLSVGRCLLPRGSETGDLLMVVVANEMFSACETFEAEVGVQAAMDGIRTWAATSGQADLLSYLRQFVPATDYFMTQEEKEGGLVLRGIRRAAETLLLSQFQQEHAHLRSNGQLPFPEIQDLLSQSDVSPRASFFIIFVCASANIRCCRGGPAPVGQQVQGHAPEAHHCHPDHAWLPSPNRLESFTEEERKEWQAYEQCVVTLNSLATLAGFAQVVIPVPISEGSWGSISLLGLASTELQLVKMAAQLGPLIAKRSKQIAVDLLKEATAAPAREAEGESGAEHGKNGAQEARGPLNSETQPSKREKQATTPTAPGLTPPARIKAEEFKELGNTAFKQGRYHDAVRQYTSAIDTYPKDSIYLSNRAAALLKLMKFEEAEADCSEALRLALSVKPLLRRAVARRALQKFDEAEKDLKWALQLEPNNRQAKLELKDLQASKQSLEEESSTTVVTLNGSGAPAQEDLFL